MEAWTHGGPERGSLGPIPQNGRLLLHHRCRAGTASMHNVRVPGGSTGARAAGQPRGAAADSGEQRGAKGLEDRPQRGGGYSPSRENCAGGGKLSGTMALSYLGWSASPPARPEWSHSQISGSG